jgi:hypothetical protein
MTTAKDEPAHPAIQKDFAVAIKAPRCSSALFALRNKKASSLSEYFATATQQSVERAVGINSDVTSY